MSAQTPSARFRRALFVVSITTLGLAGLAGTAARANDDATARQLDRHVLRLTVRGEVFETAPPFQLFGNMLGSSLRELTDAVDQARTDERVAALVVRLRSPVAGWTQRQALRRALIRFRESGKPSHCFVDDIATADYLVASACSDVSMLPTGLLLLPGLSLDIVYVKDLLAKLGIGFQELRMGRYKSAVESLTRSAPSDAQREQIQSIIDELYDDLVASIAANRGLQPLVVRSLIDEAYHDAARAREAGLVDRVEFEDEFLERVREHKGGTLEIVEAQIGKRLDLDLSGFAGFMKLMNEIFGGARRQTSRDRPKVAIVYGVGPITVGGGEESLLGSAGITSTAMVPLLRKVREDDSVRAVVLRIDSPGGSATASDLIWREVRLTSERKPVVVSMGDIAASGGYYIACGATWILAESTTLTGSIGVIGAVPDFRELCSKIGVEIVSFSRGKRATIASPYGELTDDGRELLTRYLHRIYDDFVGRVAEGRRLPTAAVHAVAEGRIWTGGQALQHGLVDQVGGLEVALRRARELSAAPDDAELLILPRPKDFLDLLRGMSGGDVVLRAALGGLPPAYRRLVREIVAVAVQSNEPVLALLPQAIRIR